MAYLKTCDYNKELRDGGLEEFVDIIGVHIYSMALENFIRPDNVSDFFESVRKPVWITESGEKGVNKQKEYAQRMWPFLLSTFPVIKRIYIYQLTEATPASGTYGLRNLTAGSFLSDLHI